jgi:hypothetical protein
VIKAKMKRVLLNGVRPADEVVDLGMLMHVREAAVSFDPITGHWQGYKWLVEKDVYHDPNEPEGESLLT